MRVLSRLFVLTVVFLVPLVALATVVILLGKTPTTAWASNHRPMPETNIAPAVAPAAGGLWITRVTPTGPASNPFDKLEIQFSAAVLTNTFTLTDVTFSGPGGPITPTALSQLAADRYELNLSGLTGLNTYSLVIGPDILDLNNQLLDQDHDGTPGEPEDAYAGALFSAGVT
ncbi:MAG: hypothetical protein N2204_02545, partial [Anaerolineae bacterium]|nr:hypothetical protein [Anaerolineae bacterium]